MPAFDFKGRNKDGREVSGLLEAGSRAMVAEQLIERGLTPIFIDEQKQQKGLSKQLEKWREESTVKTSDLIMFSRQMYTITKAGIPLIHGIRGLALSLQSAMFKDALNDIADSLQTGSELSTAMSNYPKIFSKLYISLVHLGESSGHLDKIFLQLAEYLERDEETKKSLLTALRYPSFVMLALIIAIAVVNIWVIPKFSQMFEKFEADLPLITRALVSISDFFVNYWYILIIFGCIAVHLIRRYLKSDIGSRAWGAYKMRLPIVGDLIERGSMARYTRSLGLMLKSGLPLSQSLELCSRAIDNPYLADKIQLIRQGIERGDSIFRTHEYSNMFTPLVMQMISVGEESGQVDKLLSEVAEYYEREVDYDLKSLSAKIEPIMIVIMAFFVAMLALGIFLPMWNLLEAQS